MLKDVTFAYLLLYKLFVSVYDLYKHWLCNLFLNECVLQDDYCAGAVNCSNGKQFLCPSESIPSYCNPVEQFACVDENNRFLDVCIAKEEKCDGTSNCPNGKDEEGCVDTCNVEAVQCIHENGKKLPLQCILPEKHCDKIRNCELKGEDEIGCECASETFRLDCV